ncbi:MAG TPA: PaaI family thioesterase [Proteobacteria bacterium]|nr:PaaI family thioesterase [Pseudomonadota bacterium]
MDIARARFLRDDFAQGFPAYCGFTATRVEEGIFDSRLLVRPEHQQQDGFVHAGVLATMADHTAGYSAFTLVEGGKRILTIEFKINFFKPALGCLVNCRARVINPGRQVMVAEAEVFSADAAGREKLVAKATVTLMAVIL